VNRAVFISIPEYDPHKTLNISAMLSFLSNLLQIPIKSHIQRQTSIIFFLVGNFFDNIVCPACQVNRTIFLPLFFVPFKVKIVPIEALSNILILFHLLFFLANSSLKKPTFGLFSLLIFGVFFSLNFRLEYLISIQSTCLKPVLIA